MNNVSLSGMDYREYNSRPATIRINQANFITIRKANQMNRPLMSARRTALALTLVLTVILSIAAQQKTECNVKVTLLQVNDVYQFAPVDQGKSGGLARVMTLKQSIQKENPNTLFLMAGDTISPSVESITYKGAQMIDAWNVAGLDYATFGNHEFDFGPDVLKQRIKESKFSWVAANVIDNTTKKTFADVPPYVVREFGGVKVGIFGLVLPDTKITSKPGENVEFRSPCETAKEMVSTLHAQGVKVVVALTHLSMKEDKEVARCADVDLIVGGHEHTLLESHAGGAPIFKMTADARELARIDLNISPTTGELESIDWKVIPVDATTQEAPEFTAIYRKYSALMAELAKPIGNTLVALDARSSESRNQETNVGNFITDAFRKALASDVALMNGGSVRADSIIGPGKLTQRDLLSILPFKNKLVKIEISGATLRAALEHGVSQSGGNTEPGAFPQVAGIQYSFDTTRQPGARLVEVKVNGLPLDDTRKYTLTTTTFVGLDGGDGYSMFKGATVVTPPESSPLDVDVVKKAITSVRSIAPKVEGRIKRVDAAQKAASNCK